MMLGRRDFVVAAFLAAAASSRALAAGRRVHVVRIAKMSFGPAPSGLRAGDVIEWVNADMFRHTATARNGAFDVDIQPGASARTTLRSPGPVAFYCRYHPGMTGRLEVASVAAPNPG